MATPTVDAAPSLPFDVLLSYVPPSSLPVLALVCRDFRRLSRDQGICRACVARHLGLERVAGTARRPEFWHAATKASLVTLVPVARGAAAGGGSSSLPSLALSHGCTIADIRRLNGLGSDGALGSYAHVAVPAGSETARASAPRRAAAVRFLGAARREVLVLLPPGRDGEDQSDDVQEEDEERRRGGAGVRGGRQGSIPRTAVAAAAAPSGAAAQEEEEEERRRASQPLGAQLRQKLCEMVGRAARVDAGSASYYLDGAGGDVAEALSSAREDARWAASRAGAAARAGARGRLAPLRAFIEAEGALTTTARARAP